MGKLGELKTSAMLGGLESESVETLAGSQHPVGFKKAPS